MPLDALNALMRTVIINITLIALEKLDKRLDKTQSAPNANRPCPKGLKGLVIIKTETETMILVHQIVFNTKANLDKKGRGFNRWSRTLIN